jgi:hypothetical protein
MRTLTYLAVIAAVGTAFSAQSVNYKFIANNSSVETKLCVAAGMNDKQKLRRLISTTLDSKYLLANSVVCNGKLISHFAYQYGASDTFKMLNKATMRKNKLNHPRVTIEDITTANLNDDRTVIIYVGEKYAN